MSGPGARLSTRLHARDGSALPVPSVNPAQGIAAAGVQALAVRRHGGQYPDVHGRENFPGAQGMVPDCELRGTYRSRPSM